MSNKNVLHRSKLEDFIQWLVDKGHSPIKNAASFQVLRWKVKGSPMPIIFDGKSPEHFSCNAASIDFVYDFIKESKKAKAMSVVEWLAKVAYIDDLKLEGCEPAKAYYSNFDKSYITHVGLENNDGLLKFIAEHEITDELTHGVGFSPKENKWYGWSHRAIYGFEIGSECKKGDCGYVGSDIKEQEEAAITFWTEDSHCNVRCEGIIEKDNNKFFDIKWDFKDKSNGRIGGTYHLIKPLGRGEWVAEILEDAKQMAIDFNEGVS